MTEINEFTFDIGECYSPEEVHLMIADKLSLPEYYGGNMDALYDALTELTAETKITFTGCNGASVIIGQKFVRALKKVCCNAQENTSCLTVCFEE